jgi:hypothetical protein
MSQYNLPDDVRLRLQMKGIEIDIRSDGVNKELAQELIEICLERTKERLQEADTDE